MNRLTSSDFDKMIIESIDEVTAYDRETGELIFTFDQVISGEITSESETVYAEGRQGIQLAAFDRNKTAGFTCENGYVQAGAIATQLGTEVRKATAHDKIEYFTGDGETKEFTIEKGVTVTAVEVDNKVIALTTGYTYNKDTGLITFVGTAPDAGKSVEIYYTVPAEVIVYDMTEVFEVTKGTTEVVLTNKVYEENSVPQVAYVYKLAPDGSKAKTYSYGAAASQTQFSVKVTAGIATVTLPTDVTATTGGKFLVQYKGEAEQGQEIINAGDKYSSNVRLVINFVAQEPCGSKKYLMQCVMPNAKVSGTFSLSAGDSPAVQNFEASALLDVCSVDKELFVIKMV